jgi:hypothetical protein
MKYIIPLLVVGLAILFSCNSTQKKLFSTDNLKTEQFTIDTEKDTLLQTPGGALLNIPKGSLNAENGNSVTLEIKEAYTTADIIKGGLTTTSNGKPLSSGGMIYINAKEKNVKITKAFQVALPSNNLNSEMQLYKGELNADGKINWANPTNLPENKQLTAFEKGKALFQNQCASCHAIGNRLAGPDLANFLKRFPTFGDEGQIPWYPGIHVSPKYIDDSHRMVESPSHADTIKRANHLNKKNLYIHEEEIYDCNLRNIFSTSGQLFPEIDKSIFDILKYIQTESDKRNLPLPSHAYLDDCVDSCMKYIKRAKFLNELKSATEEKRQQLITENGEMTKVIPDPTWFGPVGNGSFVGISSQDFDDKVSPNNYQATYYQFTVETFGWYNIDMLLAQNKEEVKESELLVKPVGEWKDRVNIFLIIPFYNVYAEGGPADRNPEEFAFYNKNGSIPLPQNAKAYILAVSEKDDKIGYAVKEFRTELKQELEVEVKESTKDEFDKAIASLGAKQMNVTVKPSLNADSIRAADKKVKDIDKEIRETDKLKPKNCNCDCIFEETDFSSTEPTVKK